MKKLSLILVALAFVFASCDLQSPDRSGLDEMPKELEGMWVGTIYNVKAGNGLMDIYAGAYAPSFGDDLVAAKAYAMDPTTDNTAVPFATMVAAGSLNDPVNRGLIQDGVVGTEIGSNSIVFTEALFNSDDKTKAISSIEIKEVTAALKSNVPDVGYMISGDLKLNSFVADVDGGSTPVDKIVAGNIHFPGYSDSSTIEGALREEIYDLAKDNAVPALNNDLRDAHKTIIDEYIIEEDVFGHIDDGLQATGTEKVLLLNMTWDYSEETEKPAYDNMEILCNVNNLDWLDTANSKLNNVLAKAYADPRWAEIPDIEE